MSSHIEQTCAKNLGVIVYTLQRESEPNKGHLQSSNFTVVQDDRQLKLQVGRKENWNTMIATNWLDLSLALKPSQVAAGGGMRGERRVNGSRWLLCASASKSSGTCSCGAPSHAAVDDRVKRSDSTPGREFVMALQLSPPAPDALRGCVNRLAIK